MKAIKKISCCLIVKNESSQLASFIEYHRDFIDEWIVVDTGSTDATVEIAQNLGAKVYHYSWSGDFAAARNESLRYATGDWIFVMDPDERVERAHLLGLREIASGRMDAVYLFDTRNYTKDITNSRYQLCIGEFSDAEKGALGYFVSTKVKFFPRSLGLKFAGALHEMVEVPEGIEQRPSNIIIHHHSVEGVNIKRDLYIESARIKSQENPSDWRAQYEYGIELGHGLKWPEALDAFQKANDLCQGKSVMCLVSLAGCQIELGKYKDAQSTLYSCLDKFPNDPDALLNLGVSYFKSGEFPEALQVFRQLCVKHGNSFMGFYYAGLTLEKLGEIKGAEASIKHSLVLFPRFDKAQVALKRVEALLRV